MQTVFIVSALVAACSARATPNIVVLAGSIDNLSTLSTLIGSAGLEATLSGPGPFTVFAPTNEAFAQLPPDVIAYLMTPPGQAQLVKILTYHTCSGEFYSKVLSNNQQIKTIEGENITAIESNGALFIEDAVASPLASIVKADNLASNGVVHIIDKILISAPNIVEFATSRPELSTLRTAIVAAGLAYQFTNTGPYTIFAPTDSAFDELPVEVLQKLLSPAGRLQLIDILQYHVVSGYILSRDLFNNESVVTAQGQSVTVFKTSNDSVSIQDGAGNPRADVVQADNKCSNGVVHIVDKVLIRTPSILELTNANPDLSTLNEAITAAGLGPALAGGPFTVFAPTNEAFAKLPPGVLSHLLSPAGKAELIDILTYHVANGKANARDLTNGELIVTLEGQSVKAIVKGNEISIQDASNDVAANVIKADNEAYNGVVHIIDSVLLPAPTIVALAQSRPDLSTLVSALTYAGLVPTLSGAGPFTVFAPTNEAFDALPPATLRRLLSPAGVAELTSILTYHVVSGNVQSKDLTNNEQVKTIQGASFTVFVKFLSRNVTIQDSQQSTPLAQVVSADNEASNGVVHVIDQILLPAPLLENDEAGVAAV